MEMSIATGTGINNPLNSPAEVYTQSRRRPPRTSWQRWGDSRGERAPYGSERPYIGVKGPHRSEQVKGPTEMKWPIEVNLRLKFFSCLLLTLSKIISLSLTFINNW